MRGSDDGKLFSHYLQAPWDTERWPNFTAEELSCPCCGEFYFDDWMFDAIQALRHTVGRAVKINSAHRCVNHNDAVGGASSSRHLRLAFDISTSNQIPKVLYDAAKQAGFTTFGFYGSFIHVDDRPGRRWYSKEGRRKWSFLKSGQ
jgi:hypothetical protein